MIFQRSTKWATISNFVNKINFVGENIYIKDSRVMTVGGSSATFVMIS